MHLHNTQEEIFCDLYVYFTIFSFLDFHLRMTNDLFIFFRQKNSKWKMRNRTDWNCSSLVLLFKAFQFQQKCLNANMGMLNAASMRQLLKSMFLNLNFSKLKFHFFPRVKRIKGKNNAFPFLVTNTNINQFSHSNQLNTSILLLLLHLDAT